MLVNPSGKEDDFKETDIRVEHHNDHVKEHAHGSNASPEVLEKITPAMGHVQHLTRQTFIDLGVELLNQHHANVSQHHDVKLTVAHFARHRVFDYENDKPSTLPVVDLYRFGALRLSGPDGGHSRHLARHKLRLRSRHGEETNPTLLDADPELQTAIDKDEIDFILSLTEDDFAKLIAEDDVNIPELNELGLLY
ncbi:hypothetical protein CC1G_04462 [Coprinopsis cinerea okayama7|nr:hypothetical protein CC1G_04462 [Coprinopsis cinerea okayama7\|eukprot:XP_001830029.1 hypothetical protein CC1G_04462 [Coprinopsis cinerea okayama7\